jgi:hypothetical protein
MPTAEPGTASVNIASLKAEPSQALCGGEWRRAIGLTKGDFRYYGGGCFGQAFRGSVRLDRVPVNSRFGEINSRLGRKNSRLARLREFAQKPLILQAVFSAERHIGEQIRVSFP